MTLEGRPLDFSPDGVWRVRARLVAERRAALRQAGQIGMLNAERAAGAPYAALAGDFSLPTILLGYSGSDTSAVSAAVYDSVFYGAVPPGGAPYSLRTFYLESSNGVFDVQGSVYGWVPVDSTLNWVTAPCPGNGGLCTVALRRLTDMFRVALTNVDGAVDFGQFDNDGPDNIPNSADDDGVVDAIQFIQPAIGAECGGPAVWAHKSTMVNNHPQGGPFVTDDPAFGGGSITINSYFIASGVGGPGCDDTTAVMGIGLSAHEFGHGIGLPDLYDTGGSSAGIGEWGLMGSAMYTSLASPGHFGAWAKEQLGWVTLEELTAAGSYEVGPVVSSDTVWLVRPQVPNPRGEYFLFENRQPILADTANLLTGGQTGPKVGGLVAWHIDSVVVAQRSASNGVNAGSIHGVAVLQADGLGELRQAIADGNRGDAGDPFPGDSGRTRLSFATTPSARLNHDGTFVGFQLDAITQTAPNGPIALNLRVGLPNVVRASDTLAEISVNMVRYRRFVDYLDSTTQYTVSIDSAQTSTDGKSRFVFDQWSDGGAATHTIMGLPAGDSLVAMVIGEHRLRVTITGNGTVQSSVPGDLQAGVFVSADSTVTLTAVPDSGLVLDSWFGDTNSVDLQLDLPMNQPADLGVWFVGVLDFVTTTPPAPIVGAPYQFALTATGGRLERRYRVVSGGMPPGLVMDQDGVIAGIPLDVGNYSALVEVQSGSQAVIRELQLNTAAPVLDVDDVVAEVVGLPSSLTADHLRFLDLIGNNNGSFDIGDFLAWVETLDSSTPFPREARALLDSLKRRGG